MWACWVTVTVTVSVCVFVWGGGGTSCTLLESVGTIPVKSYVFYTQTYGLLRKILWQDTTVAWQVCLWLTGSHRLWGKHGQALHCSHYGSVLPKSVIISMLSWCFENGTPSFKAWLLWKKNNTIILKTRPQTKH